MLPTRDKGWEVRSNNRKGEKDAKEAKEKGDKTKQDEQPLSIFGSTNIYHIYHRGGKLYHLSLRGGYWRGEQAEK